VGLPTRWNRNIASSLCFVLYFAVAGYLYWNFRWGHMIEKFQKLLSELLQDTLFLHGDLKKMSHCTLHHEFPHAYDPCGSAAFMKLLNIQQWSYGRTSSLKLSSLRCTNNWIIRVCYRYLLAYGNWTRPDCNFKPFSCARLPSAPARIELGVSCFLNNKLYRNGTITIAISAVGLLVGRSLHTREVVGSIPTPRIQ
jgi:hypothetical protein